MGPEHFGLLIILLLLAGCIILPIWFRHRLYLKQLDTIATAIEKGIDPEKIKDSLAMPKKSGDINGNWKAGIILLWLGLIFFLLGLPQALRDGSLDWLGILLLTALGSVMLYIHKTIVGRVVKVGEEGKFESNGNGHDA